MLAEKAARLFLKILLDIFQLLSIMHLMELNKHQKAEAELYNLIEQCKAGNIYISHLTLYIMENLSESGLQTLADAYDVSKEGEALN